MLPLTTVLITKAIKSKHVSHSLQFQNTIYIFHTRHKKLAKLVRNKRIPRFEHTIPVHNMQTQSTASKQCNRNIPSFIILSVLPRNAECSAIFLNAREQAAADNCHCRNPIDRGRKVPEGHARD
jgi:hypothetical protein